MTICKEKTLIYTDKYTGFDFAIEVEYQYDGYKLFVNTWQARDIYTHKEILIKDRETSEQIENFVNKSLAYEDELNYNDEYEHYLESKGI